MNAAYSRVMVSLGLGLSVVLSGCGPSHKNPLCDVKPTIAAHFIVQAQRAAAFKTNLMDMSGHTYLICLQNPAHFDAPMEQHHHACQAFFKAMLDYARNGKDPRFKDLSLADLKDPQVIPRLTPILEKQ